MNRSELLARLSTRILAIPSAKLKKFMANAAMKPWRLAMERLVRYKPHTLSRREERLLAMQSEFSASTPGSAA